MFAFDDGFLAFVVPPYPPRPFPLPPGRKGEPTAVFGCVSKLKTYYATANGMVWDTRAFALEKRSPTLKRTHFLWQSYTPQRCVVFPP